MLKRNLAIFLILFSLQSQAQTSATPLKRPKLVVGIVVDQMRWDYLYRYQQRYSNDGFKRILREGFTCENTFIPYTPTVTAAGHTCVYTGSVPSVNGIVGNDWYDKTLKRNVYCSEAMTDTIQSVGGDTLNGRMSPVNLLATTITDELLLATNFESRVVGVCIKDRGSIFPAGHKPTGAFWYDGKTGNWITSTYYMKTLPDWLSAINAKKLPDMYFRKNWNTLQPIGTYTQSTSDEKPYEAKLLGATNTSFPHVLTGYIGKNYDMISSTPYGNSMTLDVARAALDAYGLGKGKATDFLAVSLSSTDYVGHRFGPNSIESEDTYLRLDLDLAAFMAYLDQKVGKGNYTLFLTADHGVAHVPGFMAENRMPAGILDNSTVGAGLAAALKEKFSAERLVLAQDNYQLYLNDAVIEQNKLDRAAVEDFIIGYMIKVKGVANAFRTSEIDKQPLPDMIKKMMNNGYNKKRSGDIQLLLEPGWIAGFGNTGTTHGLWNPYDSHIPMLWMGWGIKNGETRRKTSMTDISATLAALLHIQMPSGCVGEVMTEVLK